jgi:hypothetical protein
LPRWHWQAQASLVMRLLTAVVAEVVEAAGPSAAVEAAAVATAVAALAAVV